MNWFFPRQRADSSPAASRRSPLAVPQGIPRGDWWAGISFNGPDPEEPTDTVHARLDPATWDKDSWPAPTCPGCTKTHGIWLLWVHRRPTFAQLLCSTCGAGWKHTAWCSEAATSWAATHKTSPETITETRDHRTADLSLAYVAQTIRRGVINRLDQP